MFLQYQDKTLRIVPTGAPTIQKCHLGQNMHTPKTELSKRTNILNKVITRKMVDITWRASPLLVFLYLATLGGWRFKKIIET